MLSFFPRDVLDKIWGLIGSVSEGFPTYFFSGSNPDGSFTLDVSNSSLGPLEKNMAVELEKIRVIFFFILKMVNCVYQLESPRRNDSNENTQHTFMLKKIDNTYLLCFLI